MSVWAIAMVKDEADVIEPVLRHVAAQGVTGIIVADNGSTDGTWDLLQSALDSLSCQTLLIRDAEVGYYQSAKITRLANMAHGSGATWVWPFDADELWYYGDTQPLAEVIEAQDADVLHARLWHHFPTACDRDTFGPLLPFNPFNQMVYRSPVEAPLGKVIVKWRPGCILEAGNHGVQFMGSPVAVKTDIQMRHFPYRSADQFVKKAINGSRAYAATDLPWSTGTHWREYGQHYERGGEKALRRIYLEHFFYDLPSAAGLVYDPARLDS